MIKCQFSHLVDDKISYTMRPFAQVLLYFQTTEVICFNIPLENVLNQIWISFMIYACFYAMGNPNEVVNY